MSPELIIFIEIIVLVGLVLCSAFFSGSETALFSLSRARLMAYRTDKSPTRQFIVRLMTDYNRTLIVLILGNMFVNTGISMINNELLSCFHFNQYATLAVSIFITVIILLLFGEVTPKMIAILKCEKTSDLVAPAVWYLRLVMMLIIKVVEFFCAFILDILGRKKQHPLSSDEYSTYVEMAQTVGAFSKQEAELVENILMLRKTRVARVMRTRTSIDCVLKHMNATQVESIVKESCQLFYPVAGEDIDDADYLLSVRDFFMLPPENRERWLQSSCTFKAVFVPENTSLVKALALMKKKQLQVALVCDEHGGIPGMLYQRDIYEEIVGGIEQEYDSPDWEIVKVSDGVWKVSGNMMTSDLCEISGWEAPENSPNTINGIFQESLERIPVKGDIVKIANAKFAVLNVFENMICDAEFHFPSNDDGGNGISGKERGQ